MFLQFLLDIVIQINRILLLIISLVFRKLNVYLYFHLVLLKCCSQEKSCTVFIHHQKATGMIEKSLLWYTLVYISIRKKVVNLCNVTRACVEQKSTGPAFSKRLWTVFSTPAYDVHK